MLLLISSLAMTPALSLAGYAAEDRTEADGRYQQLVKEAHENIAAANFAEIRAAYGKSSFIEAYGADSLWKDLVRLAKKAFKDNDAEAEKAYRKLLREDFAYYLTHINAMDAHDKLKADLDRDFHRQAARGLLGALFASGDGKTPETAFEVLDLDEENYILRHYQLKKEGQELVHMKNHAYDLITAKDVETGEKFEIYFQIDIVISNSPF